MTDPNQNPRPGEGEQQAHPPPRATGGIGQPADLLPRFVARLIDLVLIQFVAGVLGVIVLSALALSINSLALNVWDLTETVPNAASVTSAVVAATLYLGYFTLMEAKRGQTIGKMVMQLETRGPAGGRPTMEQAFKRNAWTALRVLTVVPFVGWLGGLLWIVAVVAIAVTIANNTQTRRGWHDEFAGGTSVIRIG